MQVQSLGWEDLLEEGMESTSVFLPGESHEQRSLVSYSPWGRRVNITEQLLFSLSRPRTLIGTFKKELFRDIFRLNVM